MRTTAGILILAALCAPQARTATIQGRVSAPAAAKTQAAGSYSRGVYMPAPQKKESEEKAEDQGGKRSIVVWAEPEGTKAAFEAPEKKPSMVQQNKTFVPYVMAVQKGTTVGFPNLDPLYHNVFSYSRAKRFDLGRYAGGKSKDITFDESGVVEVFCEIHESMHAYIIVVDTPYFTTLERNGEYKLEVPAGKYKVWAWMPNQASEPQEVTATASAPAGADFRF